METEAAQTLVRMSQCAGKVRETQKHGDSPGPEGMTMGEGWWLDRARPFSRLLESRSATMTKD